MRRLLREQGIIPPWRFGVGYSLWDPANIVGADGDLISAETDLGSYGVAGSAATTARPTLKLGANGINGTPALSFDGTANRMGVDGIVTAAGLAGSDKPFTVALVVQMPRTGSSDCFWSAGNSANNVVTHRFRLSSNNAPSWSRTDDSAVAMAAGALAVDALIVGRPYVLVASFSGVDGVLDHNGRPVTTVAAMDVGTCTFNVAAWGCRRELSNSNFAQCLLGPRVILGRWLTANERRGLALWLGRKARIPFG